ncbi:DUF4352 domain-containing protein [Amycolatopsis taiwanensis]|uniref:DUF4352 domain-containing protein n=1 Tax=Amycolatopsis taiwanensis TaxID=342230 RepID=UPI00048009A3|nr:DUF4352 domain-containing protein [Amycolatopsis taiwanensis]
MTVAALTAGCGGSSSGGSDAGGPARQLNQSLTLDQGEGTALVTLVSVTESYKGDGVTAKSGNFVGAQLKIEGKSGTFNANPLYVLLKKANGETVKYDALAVPSAEKFASGSGPDEISAGQTMQGTLAFDAPYEPQSSIVVTDTLSRVLGVWPLSGDKPTQGDGSDKREINQTKTSKQSDASADVTLVSVSESTGSLDEVTKPESGHLVIAELTFKGNSGEYHVSSLYVKLKKPDGTMIDETDGNGSYGVAKAEELPLDDLAAGKTVTGKVAFDAPLEPGSHIVITDTSDNVTADFSL